MTEYLCITVVGQANEPVSAFKSRLASFWTHILRSRPDEYEQVYAEATAWGDREGRPTRQYMIEIDVQERLETEFQTAGLDYLPIDRDETYSKYEATSPDWFQIDH